MTLGQKRNRLAARPGGEQDILVQLPTQLPAASSLWHRDLVALTAEEDSGTTDGPARSGGSVADDVTGNAMSRGRPLC